MRAVLLTHPHPDHFGGLQALRDAFPGALLLASAAVRQVMAEDTLGLVAASRQALGAEFADPLPLPDRLFADGDLLEFGDIRLAALELGPGEAP